jgi:hypothetical protein
MASIDLGFRAHVIVLDNTRWILTANNLFPLVAVWPLPIQLSAHEQQC